MLSIEVSIVVPVYRSAAILPALHREICEAMGGTRFELIFVHDAGPDNSWDVIEELGRLDPRVRGLNLRRNAGQHNAIMAGLHHARGEIAVTMDDDLQHSPSDIPALMSEIRAGADVCYATFGKRHHAAWKRLGSTLANYLASYLLAKPRHLYLSPFRAMNAQTYREVMRYSGPSVYLDGLILASTGRIRTVMVTHHHRSTGSGGYSLRRSMSLFLRMATMTSIAPLRLATMTGMTIALIGLLLAAAVVVLNLSGYRAPLGWTSLIVVVLLMSGAQLVALGVLGEYLGKVVLEVRKSPQYVLAETVNIPVLQSEERETGRKEATR